ncbi:GAF domain-containing protein, partial [Myxococcota bacterium]|nr:GAF domain-containing protein [Myxococcota bacterium]
MLAHILEITEELNQLQDIDTILDRILLESRKITNAEAGSIFLKENGVLHFRYVHNDVLYHAHSNNKHIYSNMEVPINKRSIVGYSAITGTTTRIDDVYNLPEGLPYSFNS